MLPQVEPQSGTHQKRSSRAHFLSPQQSWGQVDSSSASHLPLLHVFGSPQSAGQVWLVSPASQVPFGHNGGLPQSAAQF